MAAWAIGNVGAPGALDGLLEAALSGSPEVREVAGKALLRLAPGPDGRKAPYVVWEENLGFYDLKTNQVDVTFFLRILLSDELLARAGDGSEAILQGEKTLSRLLLQQLNQPSPADLLTTLRDLDQRPSALSLGALTWNPPADPKRASQTEQALTRIGASLAPRLITLLKHEDPAVRALSAGVLGKIGDKAAVEPLLAALADPQEEVRRRACGALGQLGDPRAVEPLLARLADPAWLTRGGAASALGRLKDGRALAPLTQALDDKFTWVQASAAEGLGQLGDPKAVPALVAHLDAAPAPVRREILQSLLRIGGPEAQKTLDRFPNDPSARDLAP
jgi:HEAT repeat protein